MDNNMGWLIAGGAAATGILTMCWGYLRGFWNYLSSILIVNCGIQGDLERAFGTYCWVNFKTSPFGLRNYLGCNIFVQPRKRVQLVAMETIGKGGKLFWSGWRPIWMKRESRHGKNDTALSSSAGGMQIYEAGLTISFLRGTFNLDTMLIDATEELNKKLAAGEHQRRPRYFIKHIFGSDGKLGKVSGSDSVEPSSSGFNSWTAMDSMQNRLLQWQPNELGAYRVNNGNALQHLALNNEANAMVREIQQWRENEDWYKDHGIPWRLGWLLHGPPGTGKTSLARAVAEDLDLPVYVYHLATLYDDELQKAWQDMQTSVPCVALIEDLDTVFDGRNNITDGHLTFDSLLNCLDGIERAGGVLVIVTTNSPDKIDHALGALTSEQNSSRPGRLDRILEMCLLDSEGRRHICKKILAEYPEVWDEIVKAGAEETGAQFQGRCTKKAMELFWDNNGR